MARPTRPAPFSIYEDVETHSTTTPESPSNDVSGNDKSVPVVEQIEVEPDVDEGSTVDFDEMTRNDSSERDGSDADDERRQSTQTRTSISSFPESNYHTDVDDTMPIHPPYTPPVMRPTFMRAESVRRMQMTSPPPFGPRGSRRSVARSSFSRNATPKSIRSATAKESPRARNVMEGDAQTRPADVYDYPLVLLHMSIIPVAFPWSQESMEELLPAKARDNMEVLKTKLSETILQRGVLIPHPRQEYELLEERLLEALELKHERITKCGHFRNRPSTSSESSTISSGRDSDSGLGSSVDGDSTGADLCPTCHHHVKHGRFGVDKRWTIDVYAANGLMRSSAWAATWNEMERVDVQITPFISEETRRKLNARREAEAAEEAWQAQNQEEEDLAQAQEMQSTALPEPKATATEVQSCPAPALLPEDEKEIPASEDNEPLVSRTLPNVYKRPSDVPVSLLLKNYISLLARDPMNVAIVCLVFGVVFIAMRAISAPFANTGQVHVVSDENKVITEAIPVVATSTNATMAMPTQTLDLVLATNDTVILEDEHAEVLSGSDQSSETTRQSDQ